MAGRLIVMKNSEQTVEGDCKAEGFEKWLRIDTLSFASVAIWSPGSETGNVTQPGITLTIPFGQWVAELQHRLYNGTELGTVELVELEQKVDGQQKKVWKKVREIKLDHAWIEGIAHGWTGIHTHVQLQLEFDRVTFTWADKVADFKRDESS
jgi:hypothetical protein